MQPKSDRSLAVKDTRSRATNCEMIFLKSHAFIDYNLSEQTDLKRNFATVTGIELDSCSQEFFSTLCNPHSGQFKGSVTITFIHGESQIKLL